MKKYTEQLTKLSTTDIRSVLRYLNNTAEKHVEATKLASMKHDKCLAVIEEKYTPAQIGTALEAFASGDTKRKPADDTTKKASAEKPERRKLDVVLKDLHDIADHFDKLLREARSVSGMGGASYIIDIGGNWFVIAAGPSGACTLDDAIYTSAEAAHKDWPEAILPGPVTKPDELDDMLG